MISTIPLLATILALMLAVGPLQAQPGEDGQSGTGQPGNAPEQERPAPAGGESTGEQEGPGQASPGQAGPGQAGSSPGTDSPFDYEASEKISEDLSVSFPVDI